ncbi:MAG: hypothetical protein ACAI25_11710 [Planctomycetota bacterium]
MNETPRWTYFFGRATALLVLVCFFVAPWTTINGGGASHEAFYFLGNEIEGMERTFGIPTDVDALHVRCLFLTLLSVPTLAVAILFTPPRTTRPWTLAFAVLLAGSVLALLVRYQRHLGGYSTFVGWSDVRRHDPSSLVAFVLALVGLVVATLAFLDATPRRILFARLVALACGLAALALPGQTVPQSYRFEWGSRVIGLAAALLVAVESRGLQPPSVTDTNART